VKANIVNIVLFSDHTWFVADDYKQAVEFFDGHKWNESILGKLGVKKYALFITTSNSVYFDEKIR